MRGVLRGESSPLSLPIQEKRDSERDAYHGGNADNSSNCGAWYLNLNNTSSNANWNIAAAPSYSKPQRL